MKIARFFVLAISAATASGVAAEYHGEFDYAEVTAAHPVYERIAHRIPQRECWIETVRYKQPVRQPHSATGTILGTMIGAAVGHQIGRDKGGKRVGRVAGALLGASIGSDASRRGHGSRVEYRNEERCETRHSTEYEHVVVGYDVTYRYHGKTYQARLSEHPGEQLRVAVDVRPAF